MKNKKLISVILVLCIFCGICSCGKKLPVEVIDKDIVPSTNFDLVLNGATDYKLVLPKNSTYNERYSADEISYFFFESTGINLERVSDETLTYSNDNKYIVIGNTTLNTAFGIDSGKIVNQGFVIKTLGQSVAMVGGNDLGTLYAAYEFLHHVVGFEPYADNEIALNKEVKNLKLPLFNISDAPDIKWREPNYGPLNSVVNAQRFRMNDSIWMTENGNFVHNGFDEYFPKGRYNNPSSPENYHPTWYSNDKHKYQLCYTARGNAADVAAMQDVVFKKVQYLVNKNYSAGNYLESVSFTMEDNPLWCDCPTCTAEKEKYGTDAAVVIKFANPIAKRIREWMLVQHPGHEVNLVIFAYLKTEKAPAVKNAKGEYVPIDNDVVLDKNLAVFYAPYYANYNFDFTDAKNAAYLDSLLKWEALSDKMYLWLYSTNFINYVGWYNSFNSMQPLYRMAKDLKAEYLFDQGRYNTNALTGFDTLKIYLNSKLAWNVDADYAKLTDNFFTNYFKDAAKPMREYFDAYRVWAEYLKFHTDFNGAVNANTYEAQHWPKQLLLQWIGMIDNAYKAIEPLKLTNSFLYGTLKDRITTESISPRFFLIDYYANTYTDDKAKQLKTDFIADANRLGFTKISEGGSLTTIYEKWGM